MRQYSLEQQFNAAVEIIQNLPKEGPIKPSIDDKLKTYALFKQVTLGPCNGQHKPAFYQIVDRLKWNAWNALGDMSKEEAMATYVELFLEKCDKAEDEHDIMDYLTDSKWSQYLHLEPMFRKVRERNDTTERRVSEFWEEPVSKDTKARPSLTMAYKSSYNRFSQ